MMTDLTGQQFGNYRLVRLLGTGGFASVYLGQHVRIASQQAAIKILHLFGVDTQAFQQEAETTASLDHPHIVRLLDFDLHQGSMPFLVMYYAPNGSLRSRHSKGMQLPLSTVIQYTREIAAALQYAHDNNIIHRDLKPENILVGRHNELLLSDFGISVLSKTGRTSLEHGYNIGGTAEYMAPEMFRGKPEKASDQYALGIVVYEWLSGTPPFTEGNPIQLGYQHTHEEIPPLRTKLPSLTPQLEAVVLRAFKEGLPIPQSSPTPGTRFLTYQGHTAPVITVAWSLDGSRLASGSADMTVQVWDAYGGQVIFKYSGHTFVNSVAWSPDGTRLASGYMDHTVKIWDTSGGNRHREVGGFTAPAFAVAWSPDGKQLAVATGDKKVTVWETIHGKRLLGMFAGHTDTVVGVAWSPDGTQLASCSADKTVQVWEPTRGRLLHRYTGHLDNVFGVAWSPDGTRLASCSKDRTVQVWDARNGKLICKYCGHMESVSRLAWSPDGTRLVSSSNDNTVQIWLVDSGRHLYTYTGHAQDAFDLAWSPDGKRIASASFDQTVQIWQAV